MSGQFWVSANVAAYTGSPFGSFTTAKTVIHPTFTKEIKGNSLFVGKGYEIDILGGLGNLITTPGTIAFQVMVASVIAFTTGAIQMNASAHTNLPFWLKIFLTCHAVGSGTDAKFMGQGIGFGKMFTRTAGQTDDAQSDIVLLAPATAPALGTGFNSTIDNVLDLFIGFSISDAANSVNIPQAFIKDLN